MFFRLIVRVLLWALLLYLLFRLVRSGLGRPRPSGQGRESVQGRPTNKPLDLSHADVEDAKFREIKK